MALIVYQKPNLLLLDEPTNHLDLEMRHALNIALQGFEGAMVLVSHDRFLLSSVCEDFYLVDSGQETGAQSKPERKLDRKEEKRREAEFRQRVAPLKKAIEKHEKAMEKCGAALAEVEASLADTSLYSEDKKAQLMGLLDKQTQLKQQLEEEEMAWLDAQEQIELKREEYDNANA